MSSQLGEASGGRSNRASGGGDEHRVAGTHLGGAFEPDVRGETGLAEHPQPCACGRRVAASTTVTVAASTRA